VSLSLEVEMREIDSGDVAGMRGEAFEAILADIEKRARRWRMVVWLPLAIIIASYVASIGWGAAWFGWALLALPSLLVGVWIDASRRISVMAYELDKDVEGRYRALCAAFDELLTSKAIWHVQASGDVRDLQVAKRNAGAKALITRAQISPRYALPKNIKSNITPPSISAGRQTLYFLPDVVLIEDRKRFGAVGYSEMRVDAAPSRFIEDGRVPKDAEIVGTTWQYINVKGGPDRRFANNRQIPICLYEEMQVRSESGLNERFQVSRRGAGKAFGQALLDLGRG
jgi:hypothetical protein